MESSSSDDDPLLIMLSKKKKEEVLCTSPDVLQYTDWRVQYKSRLVCKH